MGCKCGSDTPCACSFESTSSVSIEGSGSPENPLIISINTLTLTVADTDSVLASLSGDGSTETPYAVSMRISDELMGEYWGRWSGTQAEYDAIPIRRSDVLYVVIP